MATGKVKNWILCLCGVLVLPGIALAQVPAPDVSTGTGFACPNGNCEGDLLEIWFARGRDFDTSSGWEMAIGRDPVFSAADIYDNANISDWGGSGATSTFTLTYAGTTATWEIDTPNGAKVLHTVTADLSTTPSAGEGFAHMFIQAKGRGASGNVLSLTGMEVTVGGQAYTLPDVVAEQDGDNITWLHFPDQPFDQGFVLTGSATYTFSGSLGDETMAFDVILAEDTGVCCYMESSQGDFETGTDFIFCEPGVTEYGCTMYGGTYGGDDASCEADCNSNGIADACEIALCDGDPACGDCNENGVPDECDIADGTSQDCNENGIPDECDIAEGTSTDCNENGVPDECDAALALGACPDTITLQATDEAGIVVEYTLPEATGGCNPVVTVDPPSGTLFPVGTTTVTVTATDELGGELTCTFDVVVLAPEEPEGQPEPPADQPTPGTPFCLPFLFQTTCGIPLCAGPCFFGGMLSSIVGIFGVRVLVRRRFRHRR